MELIIKFYIATNILVTMAYLAFKAIQYINRTLKIPISYALLNRIGQALFLSSLVFPTLMTLVPLNSVPDIKIEVKSPLDTTPKSLPPASQSPELSIMQKADVKSDNQSLILKKAHLAVILVGLVSFFVFMIRLAQLLQLKNIIRTSHTVRRIGRVQVLVSDTVKVPFSTLVGGVNVIVPTQALQNLQSLRLIISHELQHHRNGDTFWILFIEIWGCLFYLNPSIHWWKNEISEIQEFACDEKLISQMKVSAYAYGQCLLTIAESSLKASPMQIGTTCMGGSPKGPHKHTSFLRRRIEMFSQHQTVQQKKWSGIIIGTFSILVSAGVAYASQKSLRETIQSTPNKGEVWFSPEIQALSESILKKYISDYKAKSGFIIVSDPKTGKVLAVANTMTQTKIPGPHWALSYKLEPASLMKPLYTAKAIDLNLTHSNEKLDCEKGRFTYGGKDFYDWKAMGSLTVTEALAQSSNICGLKIAANMGVKQLETTIDDFGFGPGGTASDFPQALPGNTPSASKIQKEEYIPLVALGYYSSGSFYATPLEIVQAYGAIANGGRLLKPVTFNTEKPMILRQALSTRAATAMKSILTVVVEQGTGQQAISNLYSTAGKTSTSNHSGMAGFVGFAPTQDPKVVVYVGIIDPMNTSDRRPHGGEHAAPVFREVVDRVLAKMGVAPDKQ